VRSVLCSMLGTSPVDGAVSAPGLGSSLASRRTRSAVGFNVRRSTKGHGPGRRPRSALGSSRWSGRIVSSGGQTRWRVQGVSAQGL
jgi:hypothetical protein